MKTFFATSIVLSILFVGVFVLTSPVHAQVTINYPEFANASSPADLVQKIFSYAIYISGTLAVIMIVYGGIQYIVMAGNESAQKDAKDIVTSAVWGIGLLAGGWLILNTINPQLVSLSNLGLQDVALHGNTTTLVPPEGQTNTGAGIGDTTIGCTVDNVGSGLAQLAQRVLDLKNTGIIQIGTDTSCGASDGALRNLEDVAKGNIPFVGNTSCGSGGVAKQGGESGKTTLCPKMLETFLKVGEEAKANPSLKYRISYLLGGKHVSGSGHYNGNKADVAPLSRTDANWQAIHDSFVKYFSNPDFEWEGGRSDDIQSASGKSNLHLDITFGGAGSPTIDGQANLLSSIQNAAKEYLALSPNLKGDASYGIPPAASNFQCMAGSDPFSNIKDVAAGQLPIVCNDSTAGIRTTNDDGTEGDDDVFETSCRCKRGGHNGNMTFPDTRTLEKMKALQQMRKDGQLTVDFQVTAIFGGIHLDEYSAGGHHYSGYAFDVVPMQGTKVSQNAGDWTKLLQAAKNAGATGNVTDAKFVFDYIYKRSDAADSWIANVVTKTKQDQTKADGGSAADSSNPSLLLCRSGSDASSGYFPRYLYSKYDYDQGDFSVSLFEQCYNPRIRVVIN